MYDLIDRPVADLAAEDARLLRATRAWVHQLTMVGAGSPAAAETLGGGSDAFDRAMRALDEGSSDTLVFERPCDPTVSELEAMWLSIWRLVRADRLRNAREALTTLADERAAGVIVGAMMQVTAAG